MVQGLDPSDITSVTYTFASATATASNTSSLLIIGQTNAIGGTFNSLGAVAAIYGTTAPEYLAASRWFAYNPQPSQVQIAQWARNAISGYLVGGPITATIANFTPITNGGFNITVNGVAKVLTGLNFSAQTNLNGVASVINTALTNAVVTWNGTQFVVTSTATGPTSTVSYATSPASGTDVSGLLGLNALSASPPIAGLAAESALNAVVRLDNTGQYFFAVTLAAPDAVEADALAIAGYIQGTKHLFGWSTQATNNLTAGSGIGYQLSQAGFTQTLVGYSSSSAYAGVAALVPELTVDYTQAGTANTGMFRQAPGLSPEYLSEAQAAALVSNRVNFFAAYKNGSSILQNGVMSGPAYIDEIVGITSIAFNIQNNEINLLVGQPKVAQTDDGMNLLTNTDDATLDQYVAAGFLAPGIWTGPSFGAIVTGQVLPKGYYVYRAPIATQSTADRAARKAMPAQIALKLAGATHSTSVLLNVNR